MRQGKVLETAKLMKSGFVLLLKTFRPSTIRSTVETLKPCCVNQAQGVEEELWCHLARMGWQHIFFQLCVCFLLKSCCAPVC
jgi:hypothetical protein